MRAGIAIQKNHSLCQESRSLAVNSLSEFPQSGAVRSGIHILTMRLEFLCNMTPCMSQNMVSITLWADGIVLNFLLSSDIRSEGSIAIVKKFDFDFFMIFGSTSLLQSKNVF